MAELKDVVVDAISLVKRGANGEEIKIYKSADSVDSADSSEIPDESPEVTPTEDKTTGEATTSENQPSAEQSPENVTKTEDQYENKILSVLRKVFAPFLSDASPEPETVQKAQDIDNSVEWTSFSSRITDPEMTVLRAMDILNSVLLNIFWDDSITNGKELILSSIEEFKQYVKGVLDSPREVQKSAFTKGAEEDLNKEEMAALIKEALNPVNQTLSELSAKVEEFKKADEAAATEEQPEATEEQPEATETQVQKSVEDPADLVKAAIKEALEPITKSLGTLGDRISTIEKTRGLPKGSPADAVQKSTEVVDEWPAIKLPIPGK